MGDPKTFAESRTVLNRLHPFFKATPSLGPAWRLLGIPLTMTIALLDFYTGDELHIMVFYLIPISLASWKLGKGEAIFVAAFSALIWFVEDALILRRAESFWVPFFNMAALFGVFLAVVLILSALRGAFVAQTLLISELREALTKVNTLSGLLPMCSWCKKVRNDQGYWTAVEAYIMEHSHAEVTHGVCPECMDDFLAGRKGIGHRGP